MPDDSQMCAKKSINGMKKKLYIIIIRNEKESKERENKSVKISLLCGEGFSVGDVREISIHSPTFNLPSGQHLIPNEIKILSGGNVYSEKCLLYMCTRV